MSKRMTLAAWLIAFAPMGAQAQMARYCEGRIVANAFYSTVQSYGSRSSVRYFVLLQNQSGEPMRYTVLFRAPNILNRQNGSITATLASYQQGTVMLGLQNFNNPSGTVQMSQADVTRFTEVVCPR